MMLNDGDSTRGQVFFVTGASGFLGSGFIRYLNSKGNVPYALLRKTSRLELLEGLDYYPVYGDITKDDVIADLPVTVDTIVHFAGAIKAFSKDGYINDNCQGTLKLISDARKHLKGLSRVILASSQACAGPSAPGEFKDENERNCPVSDYGRSKAVMEEAVLKSFPDAPVVIVRPPTVYGPGDTESLSLFKMVKSGLVPCMGRRFQDVSIVYVNDLIEGIYRLSTAILVPDKIYYITSQDEVPMKDFFSCAAKQMEKKFVTIRIPVPLVSVFAGISNLFARLRGDPSIFNPDKVSELVQSRWTASGNRFRSLFPDMTFTPLETGIRQSLEWYRQKEWL